MKNTDRSNTAPYRDRYPAKDGSNVAAMPGVDLSEIDDKASEDKARALMTPGLTAKHKKVWMHLGPVLVGLNRLDETTAYMFAELCDTIVELEALKKYRRANGYHYKSEGRYGAQHKTHPEIAQLNAVRSHNIQLSAHFGLTPGTSGKVKGDSSDANQKTANPFANI